jgi:hypothetical protein
LLCGQRLVHVGAGGVGKGPLEVGQLPPTPGLVDQFFNDSTWDGEEGGDVTAEWAEKNGFEVVESPAFHPGEMEVYAPTEMRKAKRSAKKR